MSDFDPANPLPRKTPYNILATGAGQASYARLGVGLAVGLSAALLFFIVGPLWVGAWAIALASFAAWGLAAKTLNALDIRRLEARRERVVLRVVQGAAVIFGIVSVFAGLLLLAGIALGWRWMLGLGE